MDQLNGNTFDPLSPGSGPALTQGSARHSGRAVVTRSDFAHTARPGPAIRFREWRLHWAAFKQETWVGVDCIVEAANKDKFAGLKKDDVFAIKGIFHITQGGMAVSPCTRELRESK